MCWSLEASWQTDAPPETGKHCDDIHSRVAREWIRSTPSVRWNPVVRASGGGGGGADVTLQHTCLPMRSEGMHLTHGGEPASHPHKNHSRQMRVNPTASQQPELTAAPVRRDCTKQQHTRLSTNAPATAAASPNAKHPDKPSRHDKEPRGGGGGGGVVSMRCPCRYPITSMHRIRVTERLRVRLPASPSPGTQLRRGVPKMLLKSSRSPVHTPPSSQTAEHQ